MRRSKSPGLTIEEVQARFADWREHRKGRSAIPDELWAGAADLAHREGVWPIAGALHLDGGKLKRRMAATWKVAKHTAPPAFLELIALRRASASNTSSSCKAAVANCASIAKARRLRTWRL